MDAPRVAEDAQGDDAPSDPPPRSRISSAVTSVSERLPIVVVAGAAIFNLAQLTAETSYTPLVNDGSMHAQMVRYATAKFEAGQLPLDGWYPYLGLGSPQFLHYQSLGAMVTGLIGIVTGPDRAFNWSLYLLWSLWPVAIYLSARVFGFDRWVAAVAAAGSSLLVSPIGVGFEPGAYLWIGFGVWTQLFAMWTLPFAWAYSWRAIALRKPIWPAVVFISLTVGFHYQTGYLAMLTVPLWIVIRPSELWPRIRRAVLIAVGTGFVSAWALVPLSLYGKWASINETLVNTPDSNSYGARQVLSWLVRGQIFDDGRWPVLTILVAVGILECIRRARSDERARVLLSAFALSLVLFFGRPTLGALIDVLPRSQDLFLRRFMFGVQLSGLFLAGIGAVTLWSMLSSALGRLVPWTARLERRPESRSLVTALAAVAVLVAVLAPGWTELASYYQSDAIDIAYQQKIDTTAGAQLGQLVSAMSVLGPGRVYAGLPTNWGQNFDVGEIPVFKYLSNLDLDVVGYTLRTASLMTNPESNFVETNPADYQLFGIRFLVIPDTMSPPVPARFITQEGIYQLWYLPSVTGYFQVVETTAPVSENRTDIGAVNLAYLSTDQASEGLYPTVSYDGAAAAQPTDPSGSVPTSSPGRIESQDIDLVDGRASAVVDAGRTTAVLLKVSYDPGWQATVDGHPAATEMLAPAMVAVVVPPGVHQVTFEYHGFHHYLLLAILALIALSVCIAGQRGLRRIQSILRIPPRTRGSNALGAPSSRS